MKKRCLLLVAIAVFVLNGFAQNWEIIRHSTPIVPQTRAITDNSFVFGYSTDNILLSLGYGANATLRVAFLIPKEIAAKFTGSQITKIHVGFGSSTATNTSVFIAESLGNTLAYSQTANFETAQWNIIDLTTPYTITGTADVVVGYEFTGGAEAFYSIGMDDSTEPARYGNYFSVKSGNSYSVWGSFIDANFYNVALKATIQGESMPQYDLSVNSVKINPYDVYPNETFFIRTSVTNWATQPITSIKLAYKVGETTTEEVVSGISIAPLKSYTVSKDLSLSTEGAYQVEVTVLKLNGDEDDEDASNNNLSANHTLWVGNSAPTISRNRNVVLEEYTGIYCVYCPDGHKRANQLGYDNPGQVAIINIHQGSYAEPNGGDPDFRTTWGNALAAQTGLTGYPSGTVNRHVFADNKTILDRGSWKSAAGIILNQTSPINLLAKSEIDWNTRTLTVNVEGYYTANSSADTNLLNVALLQENILGPQTGATNFYPEMVNSDGLYGHNHMLRHLLTGQWGDTIDLTTSASTFSKQYTYTIPEHINNVPVVLNDLTVVGFITEGKQEIITGTTSKIQHILYIAPSIDLISLTQQIHQTSDDKILVKAVVKNISQETITSYSLRYGIANESLPDFEVSGKNLLPLENDTILLPLISVALGEEKTLNVSVEQVNGETSTITSQLSLKVKKDLGFANSRSLVLKLWQDKYGSETSWTLFGPDQEIVSSGGPYSDLSANGTKLNTENLNIPQDGVYRFEIYDSYGDGINSGAGAGKYEIRSGDDILITSDNGQFGSKGIKYISVTSGSSINHISASNISVYNIEDNLYLNSPYSIAYVSVYDVFGKQVILQNKVRDYISLKELTKGIYIVKVLTQTGVEKTVKVIK